MPQFKPQVDNVVSRWVVFFSCQSIMPWVGPGLFLALCDCERLVMSALWCGVFPTKRHIWMTTTVETNDENDVREKGDGDGNG